MTVARLRRNSKRIVGVGYADAVAWDTEGTRTRLLDAGVRQFAALGFAGARIDAIARDAGINKERVYRYFGDKQGLFAAVLEHELGTFFDGLEIEDTTPEGIGEFAGRMFDRCLARPELPRLLVWESLELDAPVAVDSREPTCAVNASRICASVGGLGGAAAEHLLLSAISVVVGWWSLSRLTEVVLSDPASAAVRRGMVVDQVTALARAAGQAGRAG